VKPLPYISEHKNPPGILIRVHCQPRASTPGLAGLHGTALRLRLKSPPADGKANKEAIRILSAIFNVPKKDVILKKGKTSREKTFLVLNMTKNKAKMLSEKGVIP